MRWAYQPKSKLKRKSTEVPGYRIGVTKAWDSWHTGIACVIEILKKDVENQNSSPTKVQYYSFSFIVTGSLSGSSQASERLMDDIMLRKFIEGVFYELLISDIVIKRRDNQIIIAFYAAGAQGPMKLYFLVGFCERLLTELFGCIVKLEVVSQLVRVNSPRSPASS